MSGRHIPVEDEKQGQCQSEQTQKLWSDWYCNLCWTCNSRYLTVVINYTPTTVHSRVIQGVEAEKGGFEWRLRPP